MPSRPPPAYPHPPPALTVSSQGAVTTTVTPSSAAVSPVPPAQVLSQTATTIATTSSTTTGTAPKTTSSASTNCLIRPKRPRNLLTGREAKKRLKRHSSVKVYAYHASQKMQNVDILPFSKNILRSNFRNMRKCYIFLPFHSQIFSILFVFDALKSRSEGIYD